MTNEDRVKTIVSDAELYGYPHGKVRVESPTRGILSDMKYLGTRENRREEAWRDAVIRLTA